MSRLIAETPPDGCGVDLDPHTSELVMGLHWTPPGTAAPMLTRAANLDAVCRLVDVDGRALEIVHPGQVRTSNSSVLHTGDSRNGASTWDDERIFVFLRALPDAVATLEFIVVSVDGRAFCDIAGASCHVSDHGTDEEMLRVELTALGQVTRCCIATLGRSSAGWRIYRGDPHGRSSSALPSLAGTPYSAS